MRSLLAKITVKVMALALLSTFLVGAASNSNANACEICVQLVTNNEVWYGCASAYGNLGTEWCVPLGDHCDAGGSMCDPTPGGCDEYPCQPGCSEPGCE